MWCRNIQPAPAWPSTAGIDKGTVLILFQRKVLWCLLGFFLSYRICLFILVYEMSFSYSTEIIISAIPDSEKL